MGEEKGFLSLIFFFFVLFFCFCFVLFSFCSLATGFEISKAFMQSLDCIV